MMATIMLIMPQVAFLNRIFISLLHHSPPDPAPGNVGQIVVALVETGTCNVQLVSYFRCSPIKKWNHKSHDEKPPANCLNKLELKARLARERERERERDTERERGKEREICI